jgi:hypothetical protein
VSTAPSSTETDAGQRFLATWRRGLRDVGALLRFRTCSLRGRSRAVALWGLGVIVLLTVLAGWLPAYLPDNGQRVNVQSLLPSALVGVLVIAVISSAASGGGRELIPRDQAVAFPVSSHTDHLGALLMAPLNIAWLLQTWALFGSFAYVAGPSWGLVLTQLLVLVWVVAATAIAQVVGWAVEWLRRGPRGLWVARGLIAVGALGGAYLVASGALLTFLQRTPTLQVAIAALQGRQGVTTLYVVTMLELIVVTVVFVVVGATLAGLVARRPSRDVLSLEASQHAARPHPTSDLRAMLRTDRVGIWRSVPLRRGLAVLAIMPGLVAVAGGLQWQMVTILPGLVASGGALLFGVNSWCLDGRGALWRDSLPVNPRLVFVSRAMVLVEVLLVASLVTIVMASLRAGIPSWREFVAVACAAVVVVLQVVSASLRWSVRRPFAVDMRSPRATPAPPLVMVGYSSRLALSTTMVGILFSLLARVPWEWSVLFALPMVLISLYRLTRTSEAWTDPGTRSRVVATVAS